MLSEPNILIVTTDGGTAHPDVEAAVARLRQRDIIIIYADENQTAPPQIGPLLIRPAPAMTEPLVLLKQTGYERANPNQPWYAKFDKASKRGQFSRRR